MRFTRQDYCERIKDLRFQIFKINQNCEECCKSLCTRELKNRMACLQANAEKHLELLDRVIRIIEMNERND